MTLDRNALLGALRGSAAADWILVERERERVVLDEGARSARHEQGRTWSITVHEDVPNGRGTAHLEIDAATDESAGAVVAAARAGAQAAVGPAWSSQPPSAPAKVALADPTWGTGDLEPVARDVIALAHRPDRAAVTLAATAIRERTFVTTKQGFHATWPGTYLAARALVVLGDRSLAIARTARRAADLGLAAAIGGAATDLAALALATAASPGPCTLVLRDEALLHGGAYGVWEIFAAFADAVVDRQGLTRYKLGAPIAPGADTADEPLTIASDGTIDFGVRSAAVGDEGEAVRAFPLVERGVASGLGMPPREAALRRREPNGGVRELVVEAGSWGGAIDGLVGDRDSARVLEVRRLRDLRIDRYAGDAQLEIGLAIEHVGGAHRPVAGGTIRLDLVAALAAARRGTAKIARGPYHGPGEIVIERVEVV